LRHWAPELNYKWIDYAVDEVLCHWHDNPIIARHFAFTDDELRRVKSMTWKLTCDSVNDACSKLREWFQGRYPAFTGMTDLAIGISDTSQTIFPRSARPLPQWLAGMPSSHDNGKERARLEEEFYKNLANRACDGLSLDGLLKTCRELIAAMKSEGMDSGMYPPSIGAFYV